MAAFDGSPINTTAATTGATKSQQASIFRSFSKLAKSGIGKKKKLAFVHNARAHGLRSIEAPHRRATQHVRRDLRALRVPHQDDFAARALAGVARHEGHHGRHARGLGARVVGQCGRVVDGDDVGAGQLLRDACRDVADDAGAGWLETCAGDNHVDGVAADAGGVALCGGGGGGGEAGDEQGGTHFVLFVSGLREVGWCEIGWNSARQSKKEKVRASEGSYIHI